MRKIILLSCLVICSLSLLSSDLNIIPKPLKAERKEGYFAINPTTTIAYNHEDIAYLSEFLNDFLKENFGFTLTSQLSIDPAAMHTNRLVLGLEPSSRLSIDNAATHTSGLEPGRNLSVRQSKDNTGMHASSFAQDAHGSVYFLLDPTINDESYQLSIAPHSITLSGGKAGLFYGLQSLKQLISPYQKDPILIPQAEIEDAPRFAYRGAMLDVARYFFSVDEVKRFIDLMAFYKLNTFHWHLTEDAGWRIEIDKYPLLTRVGAWRRGTQSNHDPGSFDRLPHGGYYTKEQMKQVVAYAASRNLTVIPEIDMPGHTLSVLAAYPEYSCTGGPFKVLEHWGIQEDVLCAGKEITYDFIEDVLDELLEIFPSEVIHIGGDEAPKNRWKACPHCQARMKQEGLENEDELQSYFVKRVGTYLQSKGRKMMGWDEILEGGLAPNAMVMSWRGEDGGIEAARMGHEVVMAPNVFMYLDYYQGVPEEEPLNIWGDVPLQRVYEYEPFTPRIPQNNQKYIVGVQGNLWMEYIHSLAKLDYMAFPRLAAVAEVGWSDPHKDFSDFQSRLSANLRWLDKKGVNFRVPNPIGFQSIETDQEEVEIRLSPPILNSIIYYTLDGKDPLQYGKTYDGPIKVDLSSIDSVELRCVVRTETGRVSGTRKAVIRVTNKNN